MIMIIVIMLMNMAMNMFDVWSARLGHSRPLPAALPAPPTHKLRTKIPDQPLSRTLIFLKKLCAASSSSSPLSNQMDPVVSLTCRSIFPPSPTETQLKCSPPHCTTLYCKTYSHCLQTSSSWQHAILYCTGQPQLS